MTYNYSNIVDNLLVWYDENKRSLRWRDDPKPYYVWVSEIMLQQTRVEAVKGYFDRFIGELPTIADLASADEEKLLKIWEGLGYYNRVRNLKKAAITVMNEYNGELPANYNELLKLTGIGSYTAGAIGSIAYGLKEPAVDGNVLRVTKRVAGSYDDITKQSVKKQVEDDLRLVMPNRPGDFNQALMELGATVCLPNGRPLCEKCPIADVCQGYQKNIMMELPVKPSKKARKLENKTVIVFEYQSKYAIRRRDKKGLLAGLWELPNVEGNLSLEEVEGLLKKLGVHQYQVELLGKYKHIFSHIEWHMLGYKISLEDHELITNQVVPMNMNGTVSLLDYIWVSEDELKQEYALPVAFEAYKCWK